jgi:ABC-type antimicrobial peptide transport system, permease component
MLLAAAGLLLRSFNRLLNVDKGFEPGHVLTMQIALTSGRYKTDAAALQYVTEVARRVESLPAVESAGFSSNIPFSGNSISGDFGIEGRPIDPGEQIIGSKQVVTSGYFAAMHIPVIRGRGFSGRDSADSPCVVAVDQLFAKRYFGNIDPLGKRVTFGWAGDEPCEVVGIVGAIREFSLTAQASPTVYAPLAQRAAVLEDFPLGLAVRTKQDPLDLSGAIRDEIHRLDGSQVIDQLKTMNDVVNDSVSSRRAPLWLFGGFAVIAVLLSAIGIYGVMSYYVSQRRREIGTRLALGAQRSDILRLVLGRVAQLVLTGVALGAALAYATSRSLAGLLYATQPHDPLTFAAVATLLCTIAVIASAAPVFRATSIDPQVALRSE